MTADEFAARDPLDPAMFALLADSYARLTGEALVGPGQGPDWLYETAPFAMLAHDGQADPRFIYANRAAQRCFEYDWGEIVGLPSRFSAEPDERPMRQRLLDAVARDGYVRGYRGIRIAKSGRRFWIEDGVIWQLIDEAGVILGQAAMLPAWRDV